MLSNYPFDARQCSRLLLTAEYCTIAGDCSGDQAASSSDIAVLNAFVDAAKLSNVVPLLGWTWSYEDLQGLYIGLLAAAVAAIASALTALLGLVIAYFDGYLWEQLWVNLPSCYKSCNGKKAR